MHMDPDTGTRTDPEMMVDLRTGPSPHLTPTPGSPDELSAFAEIQAGFPAMFRDVFSDPKAPRTVVVVPSLSLDPVELAKIDGVAHYEERMLCLLMLLRLPRTQLIYITSSTVDPAIVDYYLHLLPGIPARHARQRLTMLSVDDPTLLPLTDKVLRRPMLIDRIRRAIRHPAAAHLTCFSSTAAERTLAVQLGIPMYAPDPAHSNLGSKSAGRQLLRDCGLRVPDGFEFLRDRADVIEALRALHARKPNLKRAVLKLNEGFSGEGNAVISLKGLADDPSPQEFDRRVENMRCVAAGETPERFLEKLTTMGGIVEAMIAGERKRSPSVQVRIDPVGTIQLVSTHDQVLGGAGDQVFLGCTFPARAAYRASLHDAGRRVGAVLRDRGVIGRFAIDFVSTRKGRRWRHHAIEINLRKGGTTLPYLMLEFLTNGTYDQETGVFRTPTGDIRTYYATDNLVRDAYQGMMPAELIDLAVYKDLHYDATSQRGLVFHLMGAVTDHGKVGIVAIDEKRGAARRRYKQAVATLDESLDGTAADEPERT